MKTAEEWVEDSEGKWDAEYVRAIQADALISAKEICLKQNLSILGYDLRVEGCKLCENAIASEAKKLE